jgi:hypothetical protein
MMRRQILTLCAFAILLSIACGPGTAPTGQLPMVTITPETFESVRAEFNKTTDQTRVIVLLSPT